MFELESEKCFCSLCIWPADPRTHYPFKNRSRTWYTARAGDVFLFQGNRETIKRVTLYRVYPTDQNDREVPCAQDWLDGLV